MHSRRLARILQLSLQFDVRRQAIVLALMLSSLTSPSLMSQSFSAGWPIVSSVSLDNANPKVGDVIKWRVVIDCFDTGVRNINIDYKDPLGVRSSAEMGNSFSLVNNSLSKGEFEVALKITEQAPNGTYQVLSVVVQCVGLGNGRYERGGYTGNLGTIGFNVVGNLSSQDSPPKVNIIRTVSPNTVSKGERVIIGAKISNLVYLEGGYIVLEGPGGSNQDCNGGDLTGRGGFEWEIKFGCTVTNQWPTGTWKIGYIRISGRAGLNVDNIGYNKYPFNSTDQAQRELTLSQNPSIESGSIPGSTPLTTILNTVVINVVELSPTAAAKIAAAAKSQFEAVSKSQALPLLSTSSLLAAMATRFGSVNGSLLATQGCIRNLEAFYPDGIIAEIEGQVGQTWNSLVSNAKWIQTESCAKDYGIYLSVMTISNESSFRTRIKYGGQELVVPTVRVTETNFSRANLEAVAMAVLDLSEIEAAKAAADKAAADKAAADKAAADAKAAADLKAKQGAEAKAAADKVAANKKITITCVKGKIIKKVTAAKPTCPTGFKKK